MSISSMRGATCLWGALLVLGLSGSIGCKQGDAPPQAESESAPTAEKQRQWQATDCMFRFGDEVVTFADVEQMYRAQALSAERPLSTFTPEAVERYLRQVGLDLLLARVAQDQGIEETEEYRRAYFLWATQELPKVWVEREVTEKVKMTDEEILMHAPLALPEVQVRVAVKRDADAAQDVYERLRAGEDMDELVRAESEGLSTARGGLSSWLNVGITESYPPPVVERFLAAEVGEVLPPFYQDIGFLVVRVEGKRSAEDVRNEWLQLNREGILLKRRQEVYRQRADEVLERLNGRVDSTLLEPAATETERDGPAVLVRVGDMEFSPTEVLGGADFGQHGSGELATRAFKFLETAALTLDAMEKGFEGDTLFAEKRVHNEPRLLAGALKEREGAEAARAEVTDEQLEAYIKAFPDGFVDPERRTLRLIQCDSEASAVAALSRLGAGEEFAALATELSTHPTSAANGGELGEFEAQQVPEPLREVVFALDEGQFTKPPLAVQSEGRPVWLIIRVESVVNAAPVPLERVKRPLVEGKVRTWLRTKTMDELVNRAVEKYRYETCF